MVATERDMLTVMKMAELKALAQEKGITPIGNKSVKQISNFRAFSAAFCKICNDLQHLPKFKVSAK